MRVAGRREAILRIIVEDYISGTMPVASKSITDRHGLKVSSATIRNDMAYLEQEGYITRPHHSAGGIPAAKAYRYYVESIVEDIELPLAEQYMMYELLKEAKEEIEEWLKLAAALLARFVHNIAIITYPKATQCRLKHLDLVALQDFIALLVLVLYEAKVRQQILSFNERITQDELTRLANKLTSAYAGMSSSEILANTSELSLEEERVTGCLIDMMATEDKLEYGRPYIEGLRLMLDQPEFADSPRTLKILEVLEKEDWLKNLKAVSYQLSANRKGKVKVLIGEENPEVALQDLSVVISQYGIPDKASGVIGVLGPKRMDYARAISSLNCLSTLLSESITEYL
jgi:heat-inducible transcriptional repressor